MYSTTVLTATPARLAAAQPLQAPAPAPAPPTKKDEFKWSEAMELPTYVYGAASGSLSSLTGFANRYPAGGVTINPNGIIRNPEWTRSFGEGTVAHQIQPVVAGLTAGIALLRGGFELHEGLKAGDSRQQLAGGVDLALGLASAAAIVSPGLGGVASLGLLVLRAGLELHP